MTKEGRPDEIPSARQFGAPLFAPTSPAWTNERVSDKPVGRSPGYGKKQVSAIDGMTPLHQDARVSAFFLTLQRFNDFLTAIFAICDLSDFHIEERIVVKDKRTGKIWR